MDLLVANQVLLPQANLRASQLFFQPRSRVAVPHRYHRRHRVVSRRGNLLVFPPANLQVDLQVNPSQRRQVSLLVVPHLSLLRNLPEALPRSPLVCRVDNLLRVLPRIRLLNPLEVQLDSPVEPLVASPRRSRSACLLRSRVAVLVLNPAVVHLVSPPDSQPPHHPRSRRVHQHASRLRALLVSRLRSLQACRPPTDLPVNHLDRRLLSPLEDRVRNRLKLQPVSLLHSQVLHQLHLLQLFHQHSQLHSRLYAQLPNQLLLLLLLHHHFPVRSLVVSHLQHQRHNQAQVLQVSRR